MVEAISIEEFHKRLRAQGVKDQARLAFVCPMCGTIQTAQDLISAGAGADFKSVEKYLAFSCVGRFTGAPPPRKTKQDGRACNWTLGGLFQLHELEVIDENGDRHPRFRPATPAEIRAAR